jgi:transposase-like protein
MVRSNLPLYCPHCLSEKVSYKGHDASSKGRAKGRVVYECSNPSCGRTFTEETLRSYEAKERLKD